MQPSNASSSAAPSCYINPLNGRTFEIVWPATISTHQFYQITKFQGFLASKLKPLRTQCTYNTLTLVLPTAHDRFLLKAVMEELAGFNWEMSTPQQVKRWRLPFCAAADFSSDLASMAQERAVKPEKLIEQFCAEVFTVFFEGFLPGFFYLGPLPENLQTPRLAQPRQQVPTGAVGLAGMQAGIYPIASPGGWKIIGNCPVDLFDLKRNWRLFSPGDQVQFESIDAHAHSILRESKDFQPSFEWLSLKNFTGQP